MKSPYHIEIKGPIGPITQAADGWIVTVTPALTPGEALKLKKGTQAILSRFSQDDGETWSAPRVVLEVDPAPGAVIGANAVGDGKGALHVFFLRYYSFDWESADPAKSRCELWHVRSLDNGETWSMPRHIHIGHSYIGAFNGRTILRTGRIVVPVEYLSTRKIGKFAITVMYSDDQGATWQRSSNDIVMGAGAIAESGAEEPVVIELDDGRVWMVIRTTEGRLYQSFSSDGGKSWSPITPTQFVSSNSPGGVLRLRDGRLALFWNNCQGEPLHHGVSYNRQTLHAAVSSDDGRTWSHPIALVTKGKSDPIKTQFAYPYPCLAPSGDVLLLYHRTYSCEGEDWYSPTLFLMRLDPTWLTAQSEGK